MSERALEWSGQEVREFALTLLLVLEALLIFVAAPLGAFAPAVALGFVLGIVIAVATTAYFAWANLLSRLATVASTGLGLTAAVFRIEAPSALTDALGTASALLALGVVSVITFRIVFAPGRMSSHRVIGAVVLYLNLCLFFQVIYRLIAELVPGAFSGLPEKFQMEQSLPGLMYFSLATITTVGYGDIAPVYPIARSLAGLEAVLGQLYPAIILARIMTLHSETAGRGL
jgi:hypothetical protein